MNNDNPFEIPEWQSLRPASQALSAIWLIGIACAIVIIVYILRPGNHNESYGRFRLTQSSAGGVRSIDELLISSEENVLSEEKSFVNGNLRQQWRNQETDLGQDDSRRRLYDNILNRKLQRIPQTRDADFSIRPVPK